MINDTPIDVSEIEAPDDLSELLTPQRGEPLWAEVLATRAEQALVELAGWPITTTAPVAPDIEDPEPSEPEPLQPESVPVPPEAEPAE